ncbi:MAG: PEGA domain-containing protein [Balneolaceae bacterium]
MLKKLTGTTVLATLLVSFLTLSCASIFKGSSADIRVNSNPAGADIYINGIDRGQTPQTLSLKRNQDYVLTFKKDGYEDLNFEIAKKFDIGTTVVGNIFSWGIIGIIVDIGTGAAYSLTPADVEANLASMQQAGIIDAQANLEKGDIFAFMLTTEQWEEIKATK